MGGRPTGNDYSEAIQNPRTAFRDGELLSGQAELSPTGFPKPRSGAFATVFKLKCSNREWAVRCFTREVQDQQFRYEQISRHLAEVKLPYVVDFTYQPQGIRVQGRQYPIIKMEWVNGEPFKSYIERNLQSPANLINLAEKWLIMLRQLHKAQVAHGDLQHGNIIVVNGELKLVDYDGMFVPGLAGRSSNELGHRNYQLPGRKENDFGPQLDNFSAWVIYISLRLLIANPGLWKEAQDKSDESLLFRREDFEDPDFSDVFRAMEFSPDVGIQQANHLFRSLISGTVADVPPIETQVGSAIPAIEKVDAGWVRGHAASENGRQARAEVENDGYSPISAAEWIDANVPALPKRTFVARFLFERVIAALSLLSVAAILLTHWRGTGHTSTAAMDCMGILAANPVVWYFRYRRQQAVLEKVALRKKQRPLRERFSNRNDFIEKAKKKKLVLAEYRSRQMQELNGQANIIAGAEAAEIESWQNGLKVSLKNIERRRRSLLDEENQSLVKISAGSQLEKLTAQLVGLINSENNEITAILREEQVSHIQRSLSQADISNALLPGIGNELKGRLASFGFRTALDINLAVCDVPGFGPAKIQVLFAWRRHMEGLAMASCPRSLPSNYMDAIRSKYQQQRDEVTRRKQIEFNRVQEAARVSKLEFLEKKRSLEREEQEARVQVTKETAAIKSRFAGAHRSIKNQTKDIDADWKANRRKVDELVAQVHGQLFGLSRRISAANREMVAFVNISFVAYIREAFLAKRRVG